MHTECLNDVCPDLSMVNMIFPDKANIEIDKLKEYYCLLIFIPRSDRNKII